MTSLATYYKIPIYIIVAGNGNISDMTTITEGSGGKLVYTSDNYWGSAAIDFAVAVKTNSLKIEIVDVYQGLSYRRTYIGEVLIY